MINILIAGDYCPRERVQKAFDNNRGTEVFPEMEALLSSCDYSIVNFESVVKDDSDEPIKKVGSHIGCYSNAVDVLKFLGFNAVTLANNHFKDYGDKAMERTMRLLEQKSIEHIGAGANLEEASKVLFKEINDFKFAFVNACEHEFSIAADDKPGCNPLNPIDTTRLIKKAKAESDYVIVIIHGGIEHYQLPSPRMKKLYRFFVENGADAIINHHQHCFSGYEVYMGRPIFYGLGNFCFDSRQDIKYRHSTFNYGYMVRLKFDNGMVNFDLIPYEQCYIEPTVRMFKEDSDDYKLFTDRISELNSIISDDEKLMKSFKQNAQNKRDYLYGIFRPYSSRLMQSLYYHGLIPSFFSRKRKLMAYSVVNCESHRDALIENLSRVRIK